MAMLALGSVAAAPLSPVTAPVRPKPTSAHAMVVDGGGAPRAAVAADGTAYVSSVQHLTAYRPDGTVAWRLEVDLFVDEILPLRDGDVAIAGWFIEPLL